MRRALLLLGGLAACAAAAILALGALLSPPRVPVPEPRSWIFRDVTLVEPGVPARQGSTLLVRDGRLVPDATSEAAALRAADEAKDLAGLYVAPGLVDMHVHYPPRIAVGNAELWSLLLLAHGVTTIRETGSIDGSIFGVREAIATGRYPGPRIFACGRMLDGPAPSFPSNRVVRSAEEARAAVLEQAEAGADCIKAYNMLGREALAAIVETAGELGLPVIGHKPHSVATAEAGLVDLQHGTGVVPVDLRAVNGRDFRHEDWEALDEARLDEAIGLSRELGIAHTPTLINAIMRRRLVADRGPAPPIEADTGLRHLPRFWRGAWATIWPPPYLAGDEASAAVERHFVRRLREMTVALYEAGVQIHAGTDTLMPYVAPGSSLHGELLELEGAGIPAEDVWRIATRDAGRFHRLPGLGRLEPGAPADLLFLARDPSADLSALRDIRAVLANGRLYRRADLDAALARYDAHFLGPLYDGVMDLVLRMLRGQFVPERYSDGKFTSSVTDFHSSTESIRPRSFSR